MISLFRETAMKKILLVLSVINVICTLFTLASLFGYEGICSWIGWKVLIVVLYFLIVPIVLYIHISEMKK